MKIVAWWFALALGCWVAGGYFKQPNLYVWRAAETPVLLLLACAGIGCARRRLALFPEGRREAAWRIAIGALLVLLALGQESWFRWQRFQVEHADAGFSSIGQHFVVGFRRFDDIKPLAERGLIGGVYITARNLKGETAESLGQRIAELQALRARAGLSPLFVMADQEGGIVSRLSPLIAYMPPLASLVGGVSGDLETRAYAYGERQGKAMAEMGFNMNLSPVVDLKIDPEGHWADRHTRIDKRAIDSDPRIVIRVAAAYGQGLAAQGVHPTVKHFPGLGRVKADTHIVTATLASSAAELAADWQPFREVAARTGAAMMLSHVRLLGIDPDRPVSISRAIVQEVLRKPDGEGWNYQGLLITDDLNMGAVFGEGIGNAAIAALDAGVDLLLISYDPDQYYRAFYAAMTAWSNGAIAVKREAESADRLARHWKRRDHSPGRSMPLSLR